MKSSLLADDPWHLQLSLYRTYYHDPGAHSVFIPSMAHTITNLCLTNIFVYIYKGQFDYLQLVSYSLMSQLHVLVQYGCLI